VNGKGGAIGPDLGWIALTRTAEQRRTALLDPGAEVFEEYAAAEANGVEGILLNGDDLSVQLRLADGSMRSFPRSQVRRTGRSLMPSFARLPAKELEALLTHLATLRGEPVQAAPRTRELARLAESQAWMTRPDREAEEKPEAVLDALGLRREDTVADVGAGSGFFTWRLARRVKKVFAVDVQEDVLALNRAECKARGVESRVIHQADANLPHAMFDAVLVANAYHEFAEPEEMLRRIHRSLKPGGRLLVIEYAKEKFGIPVGETHKMSLRELRTEIEPAGFQLERLLDFLPLQHGLLFSAR
jgi:SAM-dependent methyltransferase